MRVWARVFATVAGLAVLAACAARTDGQPVGLRTAGVAPTLEFREVITSVPAEEEPQGVDSSSTACDAYKATLGAQETSGRQQPSAQLINEAQACRQNSALAPSEDGATRADVTAQRAALATLNCTEGAYDPLAGKVDPQRPLASCDQDGATKYILGRPFLTGADITSASAEIDKTGAGWIVQLSFSSSGSKIWADFTTKNVGKQAAFALDGTVISAPEIQQAIVGGDTQINGGQGGFTREEAEQLVRRLAPR